MAKGSKGGDKKSGDKKAARKSFETVIQKYPDAQASTLAKERLAALR